MNITADSLDGKYFWSDSDGECLFISLLVFNFPHEYQLLRTGSLHVTVQKKIFVLPNLKKRAWAYVAYDAEIPS